MPAMNNSPEPDRSRPDWVPVQFIRYIEHVNLAAAFTATLLLLGITLLTCLNAISRKYFGGSIRGTLEVVEYSLVWIGFLSGAWILRVGGHVKVDIVILLLPRRIRYGLWFVSNGLGFLVCLILTVFSFWKVYSVYLRGDLLIDQLILQKWMIMSVIPLGFLLLTVEFFLQLVRGPTRDYLADSVI